MRTRLHRQKESHLATTLGTVPYLKKTFRRSLGSLRDSSPGKPPGYDLWTPGRDGQPGGEEDNAHVTSW